MGSARQVYWTLERKLLGANCAGHRLKCDKARHNHHSSCARRRHVASSAISIVQVFAWYRGIPLVLPEVPGDVWSMTETAEATSDL